MVLSKVLNVLCYLRECITRITRRRWRTILIIKNEAYVYVYYISFQAHKVYVVSPESLQHLLLIDALQDNPEVNFWNHGSSTTGPIKIMVSPTYRSTFETILKENNIRFEILIADVETVLSSERSSQRSVPKLVQGTISFQRYLRYSEIQNYLNRLAVEYPKLVVVENYGVSYEKRNLTLIRISKKDNYIKPTIFIDAGIHAREWIAPAQALYIIHQLLENPNNKYLIENVNWVVIPLLNPDGYEYAHTDDRFWRKTRSEGSKSYGVDPNRNFDFHWMGPGASNDENSEFYAGPVPFSEPETSALRRVIEESSDQIKLYLTFHSAAQCFLYPWGYTTMPINNREELHSLGMKVQEAVCAVHGNLYELGSTSIVARRYSGSSCDWAAGVVKIKLCYTVELSGGGSRGFDLPPESILNVVQEIFAGIKVFHEHIAYKYSK